MAKTTKRRNSGCLYILVVGIAVSLLFVVNTLFIHGIFNTVPALGEERVRQFVELVFPVGLIFVEFWFYDFITDLLDRRIT